MNLTQVVFASVNFTGRKFLCLDSVSDYLDSSIDNFTAGKLYFEAEVDYDLENRISENENMLLLYDDNKVIIYVEDENFILSEITIEPLALSLLGLN